MKNVLIVLGFIAFFVINGASQNVEFSYPLPDFALKVYSYLDSDFAKFINLKVSETEEKVLVIKGFLTFPEKEFTKKKTPNLANKKLWVSRLVFLDNDNNIVNEVSFNCFVWTTLIDGEKPLLAVVKTAVEGNDFVKKEAVLLDFKGNKVSEFQIDANTKIGESLDKKFIVLSQVVDESGSIGEFSVKPIDEIPVSTKNHKHKKTEYSISFSNRTIPNRVCVLGGEDVDVIICSGGTIKKISLKNKNTYWKIDYIGENVENIKSLNKNLIAIQGRKNCYLLDSETGEIIRQIKVKEIETSLEKQLSNTHKKRTIVDFLFNKLKLVDKKLEIPFAIRFSNKTIVFELKDIFSKNKNIVDTYILQYPEIKSGCLIEKNNSLYQLKVNQNTIELQKVNCKTLQKRTGEFSETPNLF